MRIACVIPVYNEEENLASFLSRLNLSIQKRNMIVIDDGSRDRSFEIACQYGLKPIRNTKNLGKGMSLRLGFSLAIQRGYDAVLTIDADCQHDPEFIPQMIEPILENRADIVIGTRSLSTEKMPLPRIVSNKLTSLVVSILAKHRIHDTQSGFRAISVNVLKNIVLKTKRFETESEFLIKALRRGYRVHEIPIATLYGGEESSITGVLDTFRFIFLTTKSLLWFSS